MSEQGEEKAEGVPSRPPSTWGLGNLCDYELRRKWEAPDVVLYPIYNPQEREQERS